MAVDRGLRRDENRPIPSHSVPFGGGAGEGWAWRIGPYDPGMFEPLTHRRYLIPFKAGRLPQQFVDVLVVGRRCGRGCGRPWRPVLGRGRRAAADQGHRSTRATPWYAQGGIAAVLQPLDSVQSPRRRHRDGRLRPVRQRGRPDRHQRGPPPGAGAARLGRPNFDKASARGAATPTGWPTAWRAGTASPASSTPTATRPARSWPRR